MRVNESRIMARRNHDEQEITRDASHFKFVNSMMQGEDKEMTGENKNWREDRLKNSRKDDPTWLEEHSASGDHVEWQSIENHQAN